MKKSEHGRLASLRLLRVPDDLSKIDAFHSKERGTIRRLVHGVYVATEFNGQEVLGEFAIRLASMFFPKAVLTHATAYFRQPVNGFVFIGGEYPYKRMIEDDGQTLTIVQGMAKPVVEDPEQYEQVEFTDNMGSFHVYCATPELILLQQMESTKKNVDKHLGAADLKKLWLQVLGRNGGSARQAFEKVQGIAAKASRVTEAERLERHLVQVMGVDLTH